MKKILLTLFAAVLILPVLAQPGTKYDISGKWYAYNANGERQKSLDFTIFYNDDVEAYYAKYDANYMYLAESKTRSFNTDNAIVLQDDVSKLSFDSDTSFTVYKWHQYIIKNAQNKRWSYQEYLTYFSCVCSLRYIPNKDKLVGRVQFGRIYEATGDSDYKSVVDAVKNGYGKVYQDCDGNCGEMDVVYRRY